MIKEILTAAGVTNKQGRFPKPPEVTYAVYFDDVEVEAADRVSPATRAGLPRIYHHTGRVEVYEPKPDDKTEHAIEAELDARGIPWSKEYRYWLQEVQRYQVLYEFYYTTKF
jgi:hypothetical protein